MASAAPSSSSSAAAAAGGGSSATDSTATTVEPLWDPEVEYAGIAVQRSQPARLRTEFATAEGEAPVWHPSLTPRLLTTSTVRDKVPRVWLPVSVSVCHTTPPHMVHAQMEGLPSAGRASDDASTLQQVIIIHRHGAR